MRVWIFLLRLRTIYTQDFQTVLSEGEESLQSSCYSAKIVCFVLWKGKNKWKNAWSRFSFCQQAIYTLESKHTHSAHGRMYVLIWMCDVDCISVRVPPHMWRVCAVSMTTQSMWSQVVKEEMRDDGELRKLTLTHLNPTISAAKLNGRHDNCLHYLSPVGDVCTLPLLSCQRVSPLPWPRSTFKFVRNATARLLHPTKRREDERREERRREEEVIRVCWLKVWEANTITRRHKAPKWTQWFSSWHNHGSKIRKCCAEHH